MKRVSGVFIAEDIVIIRKQATQAQGWSPEDRVPEPGLNFLSLFVPSRIYHLPELVRQKLTYNHVVIHYICVVCKYIFQGTLIKVTSFFPSLSFTLTMVGVFFLSL